MENQYFKTQLMPWVSVGLFSVMVSDWGTQLIPWVSVGLFSVMVSDWGTQLIPWVSVGLYSVMVNVEEPISSNTPDSLDLSRAILSNGN